MLNRLFELTSLNTVEHNGSWEDLGELDLRGKVKTRMEKVFMRIKLHKAGKEFEHNAKL